MSETSTTPSWASIVLVCRECRKRSSGPRDFKTREVVGELRDALRHERPKARVVTTSCLGLCPKRAIAIARVGADRPARIGGVDAVKHAGRVLKSFDE